MGTAERGAVRSFQQLRLYRVRGSLLPTSRHDDGNVRLHLACERMFCFGSAVLRIDDVVLAHRNDDCHLGLLR